MPKRCRMSTAAVVKVLGVWFVVSVPVALLAGKLLKEASRAYLLPPEEFEQERSCESVVG